MSSFAAAFSAPLPSTSSAPSTPSFSSPDSSLDIPSLHRLRGEHAQADYLSDVAVCFNWDNLEADEEEEQHVDVAAAAAA